MKGEQVMKSTILLILILIFSLKSYSWPSYPFYYELSRGNQIADFYCNNYAYPKVNAVAVICLQLIKNKRLAIFNPSPLYLTGQDYPEFKNYILSQHVKGTYETVYKNGVISKIIITNTYGANVYGKNRKFVFELAGKPNTVFQVKIPTIHDTKPQVESIRLIAHNKKPTRLAYFTDFHEAFNKRKWIKGKNFCRTKNSDSVKQYDCISFEDRASLDRVYIHPPANSTPETNQLYLSQLDYSFETIRNNQGDLVTSILVQTLKNNRYVNRYIISPTGQYLYPIADPSTKFILDLWSN